MTLFFTLWAAILFVYGLAGAFHADWPKNVRNLTFVYYGMSAPVQLFAAQFFFTAAFVFILSVTVFSPAMPMTILSGAAMMLFFYNLWQSYRGARILDQILPNGQATSLWQLFMGALFPIVIPRKNVERLKNISYGPGGTRNRLDIYRPKALPDKPMPLLIHIHGGAWVVGRKRQQALPLFRHMVAQGWMVVDINYRLGPKHRFPVMISDVLRAIAWVKTHAAEYGGDSEFVALTGGSAGGHLTALAALAPNQVEFKTGFETADCRVNAAIPIYGIYDFIDRAGELDLGQAEFEAFMTKFAMPSARADDAALWDMVSPVAYVHSDAPPMFMIHGRHDSLADFKGVQSFVNALKQVSKNRVLIAALPSGQHAYDIVNSPPTPAHVRAIGRFLTAAYEGTL